MVADRCISRQEGSATAECLAKGPTDKSDWRLQAIAKPPSFVAKYSECMGFINQESGAMGSAEFRDGVDIGTGPFHAEQAFCDYHNSVLHQAQTLGEVVDVVVAVAD